jgi:hypothetical protein
MLPKDQIRQIINAYAVQEFIQRGKRPQSNKFLTVLVSLDSKGSTLLVQIVGLGPSVFLLFEESSYGKLHGSILPSLLDITRQYPTNRFFERPFFFARLLF